MSGQTFDFGNLTPVSRANPVTAAGRLADYRLKRTESKSGPKFRFSQGLFDEIHLANNSLMQFNGTGVNAGKVFLGVCPGDTGVWAKSRTGRAKGKEFKNTELATALDGANLKTRFLDLVLIGNNEGITYYQVVPDADHPDNQHMTEEDFSDEDSYADMHAPVGEDEDNL